MPDIHDIPGTLTIERIERVIAGDQEFMHSLTNDELADMIFFAVSCIESSLDAMKLLAIAKMVVAVAEANTGKTISYIVAEDEL